MNSGTVEVGSSMSRIRTPIQSQTGSMGFKSGLQAGQSMTSTSWCARKAVVSWGVSLSWTYSDFAPKRSSPSYAYYRREARCSVGGWRFYPAPPVHSSHHGGLLPIPRLRTAITVRGLHAHISFLWRHNGHDGVSKHRPYDCLLNRFFSRRSKKTSTLGVTGLCEGNSPATGEFPAQRGPVTRKMFPFDDVIMACDAHEHDHHLPGAHKLLQCRILGLCAYFS